MADASIPPYGKRQSTGDDEKQASKKLKGKLECGESDEERADRAILKLRTVYNEDEEEMSLLEFRRLVMQFKGYYFTDKFVWKKLVGYMLEHLPSVIKGRLSRLRPNHYEGWNDEDRLVDIYMKGGGKEGEGVKRAPEAVREVFPPRAYDAGKHNLHDSDED